MKSSRRDFLKTGALAVAGTMVARNALYAAQAGGHMVGVQLYSIRDEMMKDPLGSLGQVADMGYVYVEHANYVDRKFYGYSAKEFKKVLDDLGLKMPSGHTVFGIDHWNESKKDFTDNWKYLVEDAGLMGQKWVISPWMDEKMRGSYDDLRKWLDIFNKCGQLCKQSGMKYGYHNHDFEFSQKFNGETVFDIFMKNTDPELVAMQLDIGNMYHGGARAIDVMGNYPGRFENIHVKDEIVIDAAKHQYESTILGKGIVQVEDVLKLAANKGGTICYIIEQESYQGKLPMDCIKEDLAIIKGWGY